MRKLRNIKISIYSLVYSILFSLTDRIRIPFLVKLKIIVGIGLLSNKTLHAQKVDFPNDSSKIDTLTIDVEMEEDLVTMCYEVVIVDNDNWEKNPRFKGGQIALNKFVRENIIYPESALENKISGNVAINLTIDEDGNIMESSILKSKGYGLDEEALRLVSLMPPFKPGRKNFKKTIMNKTIVIHFRLPKE